MEDTGMETVNILIADDEEGIRNIIKEYMSLEDYSITEAVDGMDALHHFQKESYDLIILDVMMPKLDGWTVCREIRKTSRVPIIMLTARGEEYDKLIGFEMGVDDYVVKPFSPRELMARIKALLVRSRVQTVPVPPKNEIIYEGVKIDLDGRSVYRDGKELSMTPKEYELLSFLAQHPKKAFSREQLLTSVWGFDFLGDDRTVDTHIKMLREHLGFYRRWIVTVWGIGYKFDPGVEK